jgi:hypothetical protein
VAAVFWIDTVLSAAFRVISSPRGIASRFDHLACLQAKRRLKMEQQQQQQQRDHGDAACAASTSAFSSRLGAVVALADRYVAI